MFLNIEDSGKPVELLITENKWYFLKSPNLLILQLQLVVKVLIFTYRSFHSGFILHLYNFSCYKILLELELY